jgi:hypothetical protein
VKYRFSPIETKEKLLEAVQYVAKTTTELCEKITGNEYPISSLTIFSHYPEEFEKLKAFLFEMGKLDHENNGPFVKLNEKISLHNSELELLRVRHPDPNRPQVGCNDFLIPNYQEFKENFLTKKPNNLREITRLEYEMIEFFDPDFDVLAYVLSNQKSM